MASQPEVDGDGKVQVQGDIPQTEGQNGAPVNGHINADTLLDLDPFSKGHGTPDVLGENDISTEVPMSTQNGTASEALVDLGAPLKPDILSAGNEPDIPPPIQDAFTTEAPEGSQIPPPNLDALSDLDPLQGQKQSNDLNLVDLDLQPPPPQPDPVSNGNSVDLLADLVANPPNGPADLPTAPPLEEISGFDPIQVDPIQPEPAEETHKDEPLILAEVPTEPVIETPVEPEPSQAVEACPPVPPLDLAQMTEAVQPQIQSPKKSPKKTIPSPIKKSPSAKPTTPKSPKATTPKTSAPGVDASKIPSPKKEKSAVAAKPEVKKTPSKPAEKKTPTRPTAGPLRPASVKKDGVDSGIEDDKKEKPSSARSLKKPTPLKAATSPRSPKPLPSSRTSTSSRSSTETPGSPSPNTRNARSKVGSMNNAKHIPGGGDKRIETQKVEWRAQSKVGSMKNTTYRPGGGEKKKKVPTATLR